MTAYFNGWTGVRATLSRLLVAALSLGLVTPALAEDRAQMFATLEDGYGRIVITFPDRIDLPPYQIKIDSGVLVIDFDATVALSLPDVPVMLPEFISAARIDPDRSGVRFGMRTTLKVNHLEAGEKLFVDLMPEDWQGLPPGLPQEVVADIAARANEAAILAEQKRKAEDALRLKPVATVRVGRNPTFMRVEFNWTEPTNASFTIGEKAVLDFDWPVPIDLYALKADMPDELVGATNTVGPLGSRVTIELAKGVVPRFYSVSDTSFVLDIDIAKDERGPSAEQQLAALMPPATAAPTTKPEEAPYVLPSGDQTEIVPAVSIIGDTVRVNFPFDRDTAAAVFRRGDTVWMVFDTPTAIRQPLDAKMLEGVARHFAIQPAGDTQVVRLDLAVDRLATLGSEGRAWVLSIGDVLLDPTLPLPLQRRRDDAGRFEMTADLQKPSRIHHFRDPVVGDMLDIVTAFPPARGVPRPLSFVDFSALPSIMGLVIRAEHEDVAINLAANLAVIHANGGLTVSPEKLPVAKAPEDLDKRNSFVDFYGPLQKTPGDFLPQRERLVTNAAEAEEGAARDNARLDLAQFYIANGFGEEAIGVLEVLKAENRTEELEKEIRLNTAIAQTLAVRPREALATLTAPVFAEDPDASIWRTIARVALNDYDAARLDAVAGEAAADSYPPWVKRRFLLAAARAAVESNDFELARHYLDALDARGLDPEGLSYYRLFTGRIAEGDNRIEDALATYAEVIAADIRPTRAEAVYRTMLLLDKTGTIDAASATLELSAEALLWRGDVLEAQMQRLLATLYFRNKEYRLGFETVRQSVQHAPESAASTTLLSRAQSMFGELFLDGGADAMEPVAALGLYYDFRELTPPGTRGDEMIRNLARRLVKVDLLAQAGDLLEYQIDSRLTGVAQAQVAADLAVIRIADRNPEAALRVLNRTRLAGLSPVLERQRRILEARALIDAGRQELALDLLRTVIGRDADLLRADGLWKGKQYLAAAEMLEGLYGPADVTAELTQPARMNIVRAAVGFVLADDRLGLSRLRSKFAERMAKSSEWPMFDFVTGEVEVQSSEFIEVAREIAGLDSLNAFLSSYHQTYGDTGAPTPAHAAPVEGAV